MSIDNRSRLPPFINDLAEEEITAKKFGPRDKRKARLFINNNTGEIAKFGPVTQPMQQGEKFIMPVAREVRSSYSMLQDPEERAAQKRQDYEDRIASIDNKEDKGFEQWKDDNRITSSYHEVTTIGHSNTLDGQQRYEALQQKIAREESRQQHQRYLDTMYRSSGNRFGFVGGRGGSRRLFDSY